MKKFFKLLFMVAFFLACSVLWALGAHLAWSVERVIAAAAALTVLGLVMFL